MRNGLQKEQVQRIYNKIAKAYDGVHGAVTLKSDQRGRRLLAEKAVSVGQRVLDAGGGTGSTALLAAEKVGDGGKVTVLDISSAMLDIGKEKFKSAGLIDRAEFVVGDLSSLPFADESFDSVLSTYSLCPVLDPVGGVHEMLRVLRRGGLLGLAYSVSPKNPVAKRLADGIESLIWKIPTLSMGCRPISILPKLDSDQVSVEYLAQIGVPLWPFEVVVLKKL